MNVTTMSDGGGVVNIAARAYAVLRRLDEGVRVPVGGVSTYKFFWMGFARRMTSGDS